MGRGSFNGFWATISDVDATNVRATGPRSVSARVVYTRNDGTTSTEDQVFTVVPAGDGFLLDTDR